MDRVTCVIVDDEAFGREALRAQVQEDPDLALLGEATDGFDAVDVIKKTDPELVFLDIQMPGRDGFEVLNVLQEEGVNLPFVIFVTAHDAYTLKAFEAHAVDYLLKPYHERRFLHAVDAAKALIGSTKREQYHKRLCELLAQRQGRKLAVRCQGKIAFIRAEDLEWVEAEGNYLRLHVGCQSHLVRETMQSFEARLKAWPFARVHRSAIVNLDKVMDVDSWFTGEYVIRLESGKELTLSRTYRDRFMEVVSIRNH